MATFRSCPNCNNSDRSGVFRCDDCGRVCCQVCTGRGAFGLTTPCPFCGSTRHTHLGDIEREQESSVWDDYAASTPSYGSHHRSGYKTRKIGEVSLRLSCESCDGKGRHGWFSKCGICNGVGKIPEMVGIYKDISSGSFYANDPEYADDYLLLDAEMLALCKRRGLKLE